jgi:hypothetical protein
MLQASVKRKKGKGKRNSLEKAFLEGAFCGRIFKVG